MHHAGGPLTDTQEACLFCRIADGRAAAATVYESESAIAFLDINPIRTGHVLIIPRRHYPYFDDVPAPVAFEVLTLGQKLAPVMRRLFSVGRVGFMFSGSDVAHAHAHVVPVVEAGDITSRRYIAEDNLTFRAPPRAPQHELAETAKAIRLHLAGLGSSVKEPQ